MTNYRATFNVTDFARGLSTDQIRDARILAAGEMGEVRKSRSSRLSQDVAQIVVEFEADYYGAAVDAAAAGARATGLSYDAFGVMEVAR